MCRLQRGVSIEKCINIIVSGVITTVTPYGMLTVECVVSKTQMWCLGTAQPHLFRKHPVLPCRHYNWVWPWAGDSKFLVYLLFAQAEFEAVAKAVKGRVSGGCFSWCVLCLFLNWMPLGVGSGKKLHTKSENQLSTGHWAWRMYHVHWKLSCSVVPCLQDEDGDAALPWHLL